MVRLYGPVPFCVNLCVSWSGLFALRMTTKASVLLIVRYGQQHVAFHTAMMTIEAMVSWPNNLLLASTDKARLYLLWRFVTAVGTANNRAGCRI